MTSHTHYVWHHSQYEWHHMNTLWHHTHIVITSHTVYLWHHNHIYDNNATAFMKTQQLDLTFHPLYLTSQPLYLCNTSCINAIRTIMEVIPLGTRMISYTLYMTTQSHFMTSFLSIYDITATAFMTSNPLHMTSTSGIMTSRPPYLWHHRHYVCEYILTIFNIKHMVQRQYNQYLKSQPPYVYLCDHTHCIDDITYTVLMTWHLLYLWHNMHCIWHLTHDLWHYNTLSITSVYYISYQTDYIWQHFHCISVITPRLSIIQPPLYVW